MTTGRLINTSAFETREEIEERMDTLTRRFAETHDEEVRAEIMELGRPIAEIKNPQVTTPLSNVFLASGLSKPPLADKYGSRTLLSTYILPTGIILMLCGGLRR